MPHPKPTLLLAMPLFVSVGCGGDASTEPPAERPESLPTLSEAEANELELKRVETSQGEIATPDALAALPPAAVLARGEETFPVYVASPMSIRVTRRAPGGVERDVTRHDAESGGYLFVSRYSGMKFSGKTVLEGPLVAEDEYLIYLEPLGGVRREATRTRVRPITDAELAAERRRRDEEQAERSEPPSEPESTAPPDR